MPTQRLARTQRRVQKVPGRRTLQGRREPEEGVREAEEERGQAACLEA